MSARSLLTRYIKRGLEIFRLSSEPGGQTCVGWIDTAKTKGEKRRYGDIVEVLSFYRELHLEGRAMFSSTFG